MFQNGNEKSITYCSIEKWNRIDYSKESGLKGEAKSKWA